MKFLILCLLALSLLSHKESCAETYQWTDADGAVHFTDDVMSVPKGKEPSVRQDDATSVTPLRQSSSAASPQNHTQTTQSKEIPETKKQSATDFTVEANKIRSVWDILKSAILRKDFETASKQFVPMLQAQYKAYFLSDTSNVLKRFKEAKFIEVYSVDEDSAQCGIIRDDPDGTYSYPLIFRKCPDGQWKIYSM